MKESCAGAAGFYDERRRRSWLTRVWGDVSGPRVLFIGLNPSYANEDDPDLTTTKEVVFAQRWGFHGMEKVNLFDWVTTEPAALAAVDNPEGDPRNLAEIEKRASAAIIGKIVLCWGDGGALHHRSSLVFGALWPYRGQMFCLGWTKKGYPKHTSRLSYETPLERMVIG